MTSTTLWVEWRLWGLHAAGYHAVNLALHLIESLLLWRVLRKLQIPGAWLGAVLFAVHPVNVESVAWITQRKNLMGMLFFLLSIGAFLRTDWAQGIHPPGQPRWREGRWYAWSLLAFILAMLSKGSVAPLPVVLAGIIVWRRRRLSAQDGLRLAPFFLVAAGLVLVNLWFEVHGMAPGIRPATPLERLLGAGAVVWFYLEKAILPVHLAFTYSQWQIVGGEGRWWIPLLAALLLTGLLWRYSRAGFFGWGYFCVMLVPVLGFTDVYFMRYALVADHYQHLALIGVTAGLGAGLAAIGRPLTRRVVAGLLVAGLLFLTYRQSRLYRSSELLYRATLQENPASWLAHNNLGELLMKSGRQEEATAEFEQAMRLRPDDPEGRHNLGVALNAVGLQAFDRGRFPDAIARYERALEVDPRDSEALNNLGGAYLALGRAQAAIGPFERALEGQPGRPETWYNLGNALAATGRLTEAVARYREALRLRPDYPNARRNLAAVLLQAGH